MLRVQKVKRNGTNCEEVPSDLSVHEGLLWNEDCDLLSAPTREIAEHLYVQHVMSPRLGSNHVDAGVSIYITLSLKSSKTFLNFYLNILTTSQVRVLVSRDFLESIEKNALSQRPSWRVSDADVNTQCDYALLISDHSVFPQGISYFLFEKVKI